MFSYPGNFKYITKQESMNCDEYEYALGICPKTRFRSLVYWEFFTFIENPYILKDIIRSGDEYF